ncbi:hypothetical protein K443DRAFT_8635 [Laccaria amethystina LaAM-08-1]|uniref:Unplaced genomic scaffold K443scaffold_118, whole genome shotgun sequence n=1 Tax=Laccaria amethystina LaAM-08-1 TaxID=1095629 RepID=A0A0C9WNI0_9AGAR|nr:hypothetical protein K443DRAFT_8635 [Laccaria amethystina LaAM-08-1]
MSPTQTSRNGQGNRVFGKTRCHVAVSNMATKRTTWHEGQMTTSNHGHSQRHSSVMRRPPRWMKMADNDA